MIAKSNGYTYQNGKEVVNLVDGKIITNPTVAQDLLPTRKGFFFGGTDYDEYYVQDLQDTIKMLEPLLQEEGDFYYQSSW